MNVLQTLQFERNKLQKELNNLDTAISALSGGASKQRGSRKRPVLSAAARARIAAAQRARWAKIRAKKGGKKKSS
jgi:hypothetical protein